MTNKITYLFLFLISCSGLFYGQTIVQDFEAGSPAVVTRYGATFSVVANPNMVGNTTANVGQIGRTSGEWFELIGFPVNYTVPANTTQYLHVLVNYPAQPDISVRFDAPDENSDGPGTDIRALNTYTDFGQWQDLVFQIDGGATGATVKAILFLGDLGFNNIPAGQVLNNTDAFGYVDEFTFSNDGTPVLLNTNEYKLDSTSSIYPNPAESSFTIETSEIATIVDVSLYNIVGKKVAGNMTQISKNEYDISDIASGLYIVQIEDEQGSVYAKRLMIK